MPRQRRVLQTTCLECGTPGELVLLTPRRRRDVGKLEKIDKIPHKETCSLYRRSQAAHLRNKGWRKQEKRANALVGANATPASGAIGEDGDGRRFHMWRVESKQTADEKFLVTRRVWDKLTSGAIAAGEEPLLHVELYSGGRPQRYVVIQYALWTAVRGTQPDGGSHYVSRSLATPYFLDREPLGVVLTEQEFKRKQKELEHELDQ